MEQWRNKSCPNQLRMLIHFLFHTTFSTLILVSTYKNIQKTIDLPFIDKSTKSIDPEIPSLAFMLIGIKNINSSFMVIFMSCSMKSGTGLSSYFFILSAFSNPSLYTAIYYTTYKRSQRRKSCYPMKEGFFQVWFFYQRILTCQINVTYLF